MKTLSVIIALTLAATSLHALQEVTNLKRWAQPGKYELARKNIKNTLSQKLPGRLADYQLRLISYEVRGAISFTAVGGPKNGQRVTQQHNKKGGYGVLMLRASKGKKHYHYLFSTFGHIYGEHPKGNMTAR